VSNNDNFTELIAVVGAGNVRSLDKFLASAANSLQATLNRIASEGHDVKEKEAARHDAAPSQRLLGGLLALLLNVLDAGAGAIVIVVELV
jgi:pheromone shutdown protein TraB